jgi:4-alpha-glucanotransferase
MIEPMQAVAPRADTWGIFTPVRDVAEIARYAEWLESLGGTYVATLPLLPAVPGERSPYSPSTRLRFDVEPAIPNLYLDFPLGVHPNGEDVRNFPDQFVRGISVGAPPDSFFPEGQVWGFPPSSPASPLDYFRACIANHMKHASMLRIDHVMGLHRLFWVPDGKTAKDGHYVHYPSEELYAVLTSESQRHGCALVGEDLGTVPSYVPPAMLQHGVRRMFVVQYELKDEDPPMREPERMCVASINTHDMPMFATYWSRASASLRRRVVRYIDARSEETIDVLEALLRWLGRSKAEVVIVNLEDLWLETEQVNMPGQPEKSWTHRPKYGLDEIRAKGEVLRLLRTIAR